MRFGRIEMKNLDDELPSPTCPQQIIGEIYTGIAHGPGSASSGSQRIS